MKEPYLTNFYKSDAIIMFTATIIMIAAMSIANICYVSSHFERLEKQNQEIIEKNHKDVLELASLIQKTNEDVLSKYREDSTTHVKNYLASVEKDREAFIKDVQKKMKAYEADSNWRKAIDNLNAIERKIDRSKK